MTLSSPSSRVAVLAVLFAATLSTRADDAPPTAPSLGAHVLLAQGEGIGESPAITHPITTQPTGSVFVVFNAGYASNGAKPTDTYHNRWSSLGSPLTYAGYGAAFDVRAFVATAAKGGPEHSVTVVKAGQPKGEISIPFIEVRHATRVQAFARRYADPQLEVSSDEIHVDGPATLLAFWWGDGGVKRMTVAPHDGFQVIDAFVELPDESGVQGVVAWKQVTAAGTYRVHWTAAPVQGAALWLIAIR